MKTVKEDLWTYKSECKCIPTNGKLDSLGNLVMGAGIALEAKKRFPKLPSVLGKHVLKHGNQPCYVKSEGLISFPTKWDWKDNSDLELIEHSAKAIKEIVDTFGIKSVALPKVGCGLGKLQWKDVEPVLQKYFDNRFTVLDKI